MGSPRFVLAEPVGSVIEVPKRAGEDKCTELKQAAQHAAPCTCIRTWGSRRSGCWRWTWSRGEGPLQVIAPPLPVTWIANDKGQLTQLIDAVIGERTQRGARQSFSRATAALGALSGRCEPCACARAAPRRWKSSVCQPRTGDLSHDGLLAVVERFAWDTQWDGQEDLLVCEWLTRLLPLQPSLDPAEGAAPCVTGSMNSSSKGSRASSWEPSKHVAVAGQCGARRASLTIAAALQRQRRRAMPV